MKDRREGVKQNTSNGVIGGRRERWRETIDEISFRAINHRGRFFPSLVISLAR